MLPKPLVSIALVSLLWGCSNQNKPDPAGTLGAGEGPDSGDDVESVVTYPGPDGVTVGNDYAVSVAQGGTEHPSFVYEVNRQQDSNFSLTTSWTTFSLSGAITVTSLGGEAIETCEILPSSYEIATELSGDSCTFRLDRPRKISVEIDRDTTNPMLVFADPMATVVSAGIRRGPAGAGAGSAGQVAPTR